jgi:hypothetical protein
MSSCGFGRAIAVVLAVVAASCTVDMQGIGKIEVGPDGGGSGGMAGSGGSGGTGGSGGVGGSGGALDSGVRPDTGNSVDGPVPPQANGWPCTGPTACASGYCVDNVCCESACGGVCVGCARSKTSRPDGQCRAIPAGLDPENECAEDGTICGRTGVCNGNGACAVAAADLACGDSACSNSVLTPAPRCDGAGNCLAKADQVCPGNFRCANAMVCKGSCVGDGDCVSGSHCDTSTGRCGDKIPIGGACTPANEEECASGFCVDGVCCDRACGGDCLACSMAKTGVGSGTCAPIIAGTDPDGECDDDGPESCGDDGTCDGVGACRQYPDGTICAAGCCDGSGNGAKVCQFSCRLGSCDTNTPTKRDSCSGGNCCCENPLVGAGPACVAICPGGCGN